MPLLAPPSSTAWPGWTLSLERGSRYRMPFQVVRGRSLVLPAGDAGSSVLWQCFKATRPQQAVVQGQQPKRGKKRQRGHAVGGSSTRGAQDADAAIFQWFQHLCGKYQGSPNKELVSEKAVKPAAFQ